MFVPDGIVGLRELATLIFAHRYDRVARWMIGNGSLSREQLAMAAGTARAYTCNALAPSRKRTYTHSWPTAVLMSRQATRHPYALTKVYLTEMCALAHSQTCLNTRTHELPHANQQAVTLDEVLSAKPIAPVTNRCVLVLSPCMYAFVYVRFNHCVNDTRAF